MQRGQRWTGAAGAWPRPAMYCSWGAVARVAAMAAGSWAALYLLYRLVRVVL